METGNCILNGSGKDSPIKEKLCQYAAKDARIKVVHNENQLHISDNTNEALKSAQGIILRSEIMMICLLRMLFMSVFVC